MTLIISCLKQGTNYAAVECILIVSFGLRLLNVLGLKC